MDQKRCGSACPGKPERRDVCANPDCRQEFVPTLRQGGVQRFCTARCRNKIARQRWETRFRVYGLTRAEYAAKVQAQDGRCMICGEVPVHAKFSGLVSDHDHQTGQNRDLLCANCNAGLGFFGEDPGKLLAAVSYLQRWAKTLAD